MLRSSHRHATLGGRRDCTWDAGFTVRKPTKFHGAAFDKRLFKDTELRNNDQIIKRFLESDDVFDPPGTSHVLLRDFLSTSRIEYKDLSSDSPSGVHTKKLAFYDDRREREVFEGAQRDWSDTFYSTGQPGFRPEFDAVDERGLHKHLKKSRQASGAERRIVFVANPTSLCLLAIIDTIPRGFASNIREYFERYLTKRSLFQLLKVGSASFMLEFHIPYLALRQAGPFADNRLTSRASIDVLRSSAPLPVRELGEVASLEYHEAQISFLIFGPDEWFWTVYCFVDSYFGSEYTPEEYLSFTATPYDPPTGQVGLNEPVWNPREYFLLVLARRMNQVSKEWSNLVAAMNDCLETYVSKYNKAIVQGRVFDDIGLSGTFTSTRAVSVLRHFREVLGDTLYAWDTFAGIEPECFVCDFSSVNQRWSKHISDINDCIAHLRFLERSLVQKLQLFDRMKDDLMSASALTETRVATTQGEKISILTYATVIYLPFGFSAVSRLFATVQRLIFEGPFQHGDDPTGFLVDMVFDQSIVLGAVTFPLAFRYKALQDLFLQILRR